MNTINSKRGITLMELMVVIAIMGVLSSVAMPKLFGFGEKAREKIDLMKLYDLRNAINIALIEDSEAMSNYSPVQSQNDSTRNSFISKLQNGLSSNGGAALFVIELRSDLSINVQGKHWNANNTYNICEMVGTDGTFYSALKTANFDGVADIIAARLSGNSWKSSGDTYTSKEYKNAENKSDYRTAPKKKLFQSRALNIGKYEDNTRYTMNVRWTDPDDPYSVEVFLLPQDGNWETAYRSDNGTCFSTYGNRGCSKKKK